MSWQLFGSNGNEMADYSLGVLERFTRRATNATDISEVGNSPKYFCKLIANPRTINFFSSPHCARHFEGIHSINEQKKIKLTSWHLNVPLLADKIVVNHYHCKSWEEYQKRITRGYAPDLRKNMYSREKFDKFDFNEEFDDGILKYREARAKIYRPPDKSQIAAKLLNALTENLSPTLLPNTTPQFYAGKMETFLTCRAVCSYLQSKLADDRFVKFFEEASLKAILKSFAGMSFADAQLLIRELPNLLKLPYPIVSDLRTAVLKIIPQMMDIIRLNAKWKDFVELEYLQYILESTALRCR